MEEYKKCAWCGKKIHISKLEDHYDICVEEKENKFKEDLKKIVEEERCVDDPTEIVIEPDENEKVIWLFLPDNVTSEDQAWFIEKVKKYVDDKGYETRWLKKKDDGE